MPSDDATPSTVTYAEDPTQATLSTSALHEKALCDYVINTATGCRHGCTFCYVPATPAIRTRQEMLADRADVEDAQQEWGEYVLRRHGRSQAAKVRELRQTLRNKRKWKVTNEGRGIVALSFSTDCYQDATTAQMTGACVEELVDAGHHVRVQTRNPMLALQMHGDLYAAAAEDDLVTVGTSLPSLDEGHVQALEPRTPHPETRLNGLEGFADLGVRTFVAMSPTYPTASKADLRTILRTIRDRLPTLDVVFHEAMNPRGANIQAMIRAAQAADEHHLAAKLAQLRDRETWRRYALRHLRGADALGDALDVDVNLWPGKDLVTACEGTDAESWVRQQWTARSPETFARDAVAGVDLESLTAESTTDTVPVEVIR